MEEEINQLYAPISLDIDTVNLDLLETTADIEAYEDKYEIYILKYR